MNRIIVVGASHHNTLSIVRAIGPIIKVELFIIGAKKSYIAKSKYVTSTIYFETVSLMIEHLQLHIDNYKCSSIISCSDDVSQALDSASYAIWENIRFFRCNEKGLLTKMMDKSLQVAYAKRKGLNTPRSVKITPETQTFDNIPFPCILKPSESFKGGKKIIVCDSINELYEALREFPYGVDILVQEYIYKQHEIVIPGFAYNDKVITPGIIQKYREISGATTYSRVLPFDESTINLKGQVHQYIKEIKYQGLFGFEFIYDGNKFFFIELNLRNDATCCSLIPSGNNLPAMYISKSEEWRITNNIVPYDSIVEFNDFSFVLRHKISMISWIIALKQSKCKYYFDRSDYKPFIWALFHWLNSWTLKKLFK